MKYLKIIFLCISSLSFSQDMIYKKDGEIIKSKIKEISIDEIRYLAYNNLEGPIYIIAKKELKKIVFENGITESFNLSNGYDNYTLEEIKVLLKENINDYGFQYGFDKIKLDVSFERDLLVLSVVSKEGKSSNKKYYYNFSKVYKFNGISKRGKGKAIINIYVDKLINKSYDRWDKHKLKIGIIGHDNADVIYNALKHYNKLLLDEKKLLNE